MTSFLHDFHIGGRGSDVGAVFTAALATITATRLSEWLQVIVMALTVVFLCLGIFLRWKKIKAGEIPEVDEEDEPGIEKKGGSR